MAVKGTDKKSTMLQVLLSLVSCLLTWIPVSANNAGSYTVSVYQPRMVNNMSSFVSRKEAVALMSRHIDEYELQAEEAARRKSQILIFPEYCLYADIENFTRDSVANFLETIPDPEVNFPWTPCDLENTTDDITIQRKFSCMAKKNKLYIVANVGERETCNQTLDSRCPDDGRYQFNTNVVYASNGTLVSRYRKKHLFGEPYFNEPAVAEHKVFETPFGRFASITCFDIYYEDTLNDLIHYKNVRNIIFPNMWFSLPPLFISVPYHASVAWMANINLISANLILDLPSKVSPLTGGSGFYSGTSGFSYSSNPDLLTINMTSINPDAPSNYAVVPKRVTPAQGNQKIINYLVGNMDINSIQLEGKAGNISVCHGNFCCGLEYEFTPQPHPSVAYWLGATDYADGSRQYDAQACSLCTVVLSKMVCESIPADPNVKFAQFKRIRMFANEFKTTFVYPQVTLMNNRSYQVLNPNVYYNRGEIKLLKTSPLHSMTLLGRIYPPHVSSTSRVVIPRVLVIGMLVLSLL